MYYFGKRRRERRTIIALAIILSVCIVAAVAATVLIINDRDNGDIGVNVTTGEVKVDIIDAQNNSLIGKVLDFVPRNADDSDVVFEPGAAYYTKGFRVKNTGSLSLNYIVSVSRDDDIDMDAFNAAFDFWITDDLTDLSGAEKLTEFRGSLRVDTVSETYSLVVRMKDDAGNEFQNKTYNGIGITVNASQMPIE